MTTPISPDTLFTAAQLAGFCQVDLKTIHNWVDRGKIAHFRTPGRHLRFRRADVLQFLQTTGYPIPEEIVAVGDLGGGVAERDAKEERLRAAAPNLLHACQAAYGKLKLYGERRGANDPEVNVLRAAIKLATGEEVL